MFVRAQKLDSETVIYLDQYDNKWVAQGNSQTWRMNNPGLLHKRDLTDQSKVISHDHLVAIFASARLGIETFRHWLALQAYKPGFFLRIAKHYQPTSPAVFLEQLYALASIPSDRDRLTLMSGEFDRVFSAIMKLSNFSEHANKPFSLIPKVVGRFYSKELASVHLYLTHNDQLLTKSEAISWIETHRLDAVIVSKGDGNVYLRSRPGHHCGQIRFSEQRFAKDLEFDDLIRDFGTVHEGQCIWGFINGIWNSDDGALESTTNISKMTGGEQVWSLKNNFTLFANGTIWQCGQQKMGVDTQIVRNAAKFFQLLISLSHHHETPLPVVIFLHSQGAIIGDLALEHLSLSERQQLRLFTFGGGSLIAPGRAHPDSHNYISIADLIPKIGSSTARIAFRVCLGRQQGLNPQKVIEQFIEEEMALYLESDLPDVRAIYQQRLAAFYEWELKKLANVTVLDQNNTSQIFEHTFDIPCYQTKLAERIAHYKNLQSRSDKQLSSASFALGALC